MDFGEYVKTMFLAMFLAAKAASERESALELANEVAALVTLGTGVRSP